MTEKMKYFTQFTGIAALLCLFAVAAGDEPRPAGLNPDSFYGRDSGHGVYVRDSAVALEKSAHAQRMERLREWHTAASIYHEIIDGYGDRVVPSQVDDENNITQYTSVVYAVQEQLARWPREGLEAYRARYEPEAARFLEQAGHDLARLHEVHRRFFVTESGLLAARRLIDRYVQEGEFPAAGWLGERLLRWHPDLHEERPAVLYRTALAYSLSEDDQQAEKYLEELRREHPDAVGPVRGEQVVLWQSLEQELKSAQSLHTTGGRDWSYRMVHGSPDRAYVPQTGAWAGARLPTVPLTLPTVDPQQQANIEAAMGPQREAGATLGIMPVFDGDELFFQDNARIYAVSLQSGMPLPGWAQTYSGDRNGQYVASGNPSPMALGRQMTLTLTDTAVLAVMAQHDPGPTYGVRQQVEPRLVCLDRFTGEERWVVFAKDLPKEPQALQSLIFAGSPLVVGDSVYIMARGGTGAGFEDSYLLCLDLESGAFRWACYISSAHAVHPRFGGVPTFMSDSTSHPAYASGRVFVLTNLGALAAIDAYTGSIVWLSIYPREQVDINVMRFGGMRQAQQVHRPWTANPVIVQDGRVFVLPSDARHVMVYDAGSGVEVQRINRSALQNADTLLGVVDQRMIVSGEAYVTCIDWTRSAGNQPEILWRSPDLRAIRGRGFVTREWVYVPTQDRLSRISMRNGRAEQTYPPGPGRWDEAQGEGPGNVLVTPDHVVIAGQQRVDIYTDLDLARQKLEAEIAERPNDLAPRLRYAEVLFVAGRPQESIQRIDEAISLLAGEPPNRRAAAQQRIFNTALLFAQKMVNDTRVDVDLINAMFDRAAATAGDKPAAGVRYRFARAEFAQGSRLDDYALEVELYQEVLADSAMRSVPLPDERQGGWTTAGDVARRSIASRIKLIGPQVYEPFERQAAATFERAQQADDPDAMLAVAHDYPNARTAMTAMMAAAARFESAGQPQRAIEVLRQIYFSDPQSREKVLMLEAMARNYLAMSERLDSAAARLDLCARLDPEGRLVAPLTLPDGRVLRDISFADAAEQVRQLRLLRPADRLPDLGLPLPPARGGASLTAFHMPPPESAIAHVRSIVSPLRGFERHDRIAVWMEDDVLAVYPAGKAAPVATFRLRDAPHGAAWFGEKLLAWSHREMSLLDPDAGVIAWNSSLKDIPAVEPVAATQQPPRGIDAVEVQHGQVIFNQGRIQMRGNVQIRVEAERIVLPDGRIVMRDNAGQVLINGRVVPLPGMMPEIPPIERGEERIVHAQPSADRLLVTTSTGRLIAVQISDGEAAWQTQLVEQRPIERLVANDEFAVARVIDETSVRLVALDTLSGQVLLRRTFMLGADPLPINVALSPDGMLVYTLPDRLWGKQLMQPGEEPDFEHLVQGPVFAGATHPDHLVITGNRVLAVSNGGHFVRVHSLENGRELRPTLNTGSGDVDARIWNAGPQVYLIGEQELYGYNLDHVDREYREPFERLTNQQRELVISDSFVVMREQPLGEELPTLARLYAFGRYPVSEDNPAESGRLDYVHEVSDSAGIRQWQAADGGLYYLAGDGRLHFLRGAR